MRHALDEGWFDDAQGLPGIGNGTRHGWAAQARQWLRDPRATNFSGTVFLVVDVVLPVAVLLLLFLTTLFRAIFPGHHRSRAHSPSPAPKVFCPDNIARSLAWWNRTRVAGFVRTLANPETIDLIPAPWSQQGLSELLGSSGISMERWSDDAKQFLVEELSTGRARLLRKEQKPVRVVELVLLVVEFPHERCILQEEPAKARMFSPLPERTPATRRMLNETVQVAAKRCLAGKVKIPSSALRVHENLIGVEDVVETSSALPELPSIVRKFFVHVEVIASDAGTLQSIGLPSADSQGNLGLEGLTYTWAPARSAPSLMRLLRRNSAFRRHWHLEAGNGAQEAQRTILDFPHKAVLPWTEQSLAEVLRAHGSPNAKERFGRETSEMAAELSKGQYSLGVRKADAQVVCIQDIYSLLLATPAGAVLVDTTDSVFGEELAGSNVAKLPCTAKLANEDPWIVARRIARTQLGIPTQDIDINEQQILQQVWPGSHALECEEKHPDGQRPAGWVLREWVVLSHAPASYKPLDMAPPPHVVS